MIGLDTFRFLNDTRQLGSSWDDPQHDKLWRYNLHYFDDLNAVDATSRVEWHRALLARWVRENPPTIGTGWEPYPTSLRIVNWIKWTLAGNTLPSECLHSLAVQTRWLSRRLETHLLGNHLFANAKALVFAGLYHEGEEARRWLELGCRILAVELPEQILADGGQFELSPMYHAIALEDLLDLCNVSAVFADAFPDRWRSAPAAWRSVSPRMLDWLATMTHPDGGISFFNDAAFGVAPLPAALGAYSQRLGIPLTSVVRSGLSVLEASGYVRVEIGKFVAILDVARVGPDYLPAHAHADTLSFECSVRGHRLLVNSGTSVYGDSPERQRQRGTAAHNTVVINGQDSSEVWGGFRVARRARPEQIDIRFAQPITVRCAHDGYRRLQGQPTHLRAWRFDSTGLEITDTISGRFDTAAARFHLHPAIQVGAVRHRDDGGEVEMRVPNGAVVAFSVDRGRIDVEDSTWHPEFGASVVNRCIVARFAGATLRSTLRWE